MFSTTASSSRCVVTCASTIKTSSKSRDAIRSSSGRSHARCHQRQQQEQQRRFVATMSVSVSLDNKISTNNNNNNIRGRRRRYSSSIVKSSQDDENTETPSSTGFDGFDTGTTVTDEDQERLQLMSQEIKDWLKLLYVKREMSFNEVKLIIGIEDPRLADRRERFGIEDESGCSAEEKIQVLEDVDEGRVPTDIVACEFVLNELREWPGLDSDIELPERRETGPSRYEEIAMDAAGIKGRTRNPKRMLDDYLEEDDKPEEKNLLGFLPLYAVSSAPIFITIFALGIMFVNSLQ